MLSTRVWLVRPDSITSQWGSLTDTSSLLQSVGALAIDRVWALPPLSTLGFPSLGAPTIEFGRSRRVWALLDGDDLYLNVYVCWVVSIIRHFGFYGQPRGSDTRAWFSRNGSRHSWGRVLRHISTSLAITEWGLGIYSWFMTSCALVRLFGAGRSLGWGAGTLNWWVVSSHCRNVTSWMRWCPRKLVTPRAEDTRWESRETTRMDKAKSVVRFVQGIA